MRKHTRLKYKVAVVGSVIKDREKDRNEQEGANFLCIEIQDELEALSEAIHPEPDDGEPEGES